MAEEYVIVDKADLETIANSVREKTNTIDKYFYRGPSGGHGEYYCAAPSS